MPLLHTIGYERASQADVIAALQRAGVRTLVDVRDRPLSRRAGFSKRQLEAGVSEVGLRYVHLKALGTPPEGREANRTRQWDRFWHIVEERLATPEAEIALQGLAEIALAEPVCLLCYEADWHICHRRRVAELICSRHGLAVEHLSVLPSA